jgi:hypothetical protein
MTDAENKLKSLLYRFQCPSTMELGEYELGLLDQFRGRQIETHMMECPRCQADLVQMTQFMAEPMPVLQPMEREVERLSFLEQVKVMIVDLLKPPAGVLLPASPQLALRGDGSGISTSVYHVDPYVISLSSIKDDAALRRRNIVGDILATDGDEPSFQHWTVYLWREGQLLATGPVEDDSHFILQDIQEADDLHDLILSGPRVEIHLQNLRMS